MGEVTVYIGGKGCMTVGGKALARRISKLRHSADMAKQAGNADMADRYNGELRQLCRKNIRRIDKAIRIVQTGIGNFV